MFTHAIALLSAAAVVRFGDVPAGHSIHAISEHILSMLQAGDEPKGVSLRNQSFSQKAYKLGDRYSRSGELRRAYQLLSIAIQFDRDNALAYAARSNVRSMQGDNLGGIGDADYAISLDPTLAAAYYNRGLIYARLGMWVSATDDYTAAAFLDPDLEDGLLYENLGLAQMAQDKFTEAVVSFSRAIGRGSQPADSYFSRSLAYERTGQIDAAISDMNAAIRSVPGYPEAHHRRALLFMRKGFDGPALLDLNNALEHDPGDLIARADRALLQEQMGNAGAAQADFEHLAKIGVDPRQLDRAAHIALMR